MSQNREGTVCEIIFMITVATKPSAAKIAIIPAAQKRKPPIATQYFIMFTLSPSVRLSGVAPVTWRDPAYIVEQKVERFMHFLGSRRFFILPRTNQLTGGGPPPTSESSGFAGPPFGKHHKPVQG